jgi:hypothetical protein
MILSLPVQGSSDQVNAEDADTASEVANTVRATREISFIGGIGVVNFTRIEIHSLSHYSITRKFPRSGILEAAIRFLRCRKSCSPGTSYHSAWVNMQGSAMKASRAVRTIEILRGVVEKSAGDQQVANAVDTIIDEIAKQAGRDPAEASALSAYISKKDVVEFREDLKATSH